MSPEVAEGDDVPWWPSLPRFRAGRTTRLDRCGASDLVLILPGRPARIGRGRVRVEFGPDRLALAGGGIDQYDPLGGSSKGHEGHQSDEIVAGEGSRRVQSGHLQHDQVARAEAVTAIDVGDRQYGSRRCSGVARSDVQPLAGGSRGVLPRSSRSATGRRLCPEVAVLRIVTELDACVFDAAPAGRPLGGKCVFFFEDCLLTSADLGGSWRPSSRSSLHIWKAVLPDEVRAISRFLLPCGENFTVVV